MRRLTLVDRAVDAAFTVCICVSVSADSVGAVVGCDD